MSIEELDIDLIQVAGQRGRPDLELGVQPEGDGYSTLYIEKMDGSGRIDFTVPMDREETRQLIELLELSLVAK